MSGTGLKMTNESIQQFKINYKNMEDGMKWKLKSGSIVHSYTIDISDPNVSRLFFKEEIREIEFTNVKSELTIDDDTKTCIGSFAK
ncbi:2980_t:CDS:2, partial [Entrophospora sp. SA101]